MTSLIPTEHFGTPFKELKRAYIDFEYNGTTEARFNLVCAAMSGLDKEETWLHGDIFAKANLKKLLLDARQTHIFCSWNVVAEASSFISLGLDPTKFAWIDLQLEYKMLTNHWDRFRYGEQLIDGKIKKTYPPKPKWEMTEEEKRQSNQKAETNIAAATFKLSTARRS